MTDVTPHIFKRFHLALTEALAALMAEGKLPAGLDAAKVTVEPPRDASHGDISTNVGMVLAKPAAMKPRDIAALVDSAGNIKELKVIDDTEANNSYWNKYVFAKERTQNGNTYTMKSNMGLLNIVATGYSQIIITSPDGQETMIYDVSKAQKSGTVLEITFVMLFVGAVVYGLTREFSKAKKCAK